MTEYLIVTWSPRTRRYVVAWRGESFEIAYRMFYKSYYQRHTRRLISRTTQVISSAKGRKR